ncbi:MAG: hemolysin family protein [Bacteroidota bacterium]|nr:hemolysin family protein [Bacteroidota bacterium]
MTAVGLSLFLCITLLFILLFTGIEIAFVSANRLGVELKKKQGKRSGIILSQFFENGNAFLGVCLSGIVLFLVLFVLVLIELLSATLWKAPFFQNIHNDYLFLVADGLAGVIILLFFSELFTKALFRAKSDALLSFFATLAKFFYNILYPVLRIFVSVAAGILRFLFNVRLKEDSEPFAKMDVENYYQQSNEQNEEHPEMNKELFENALSLPNIKIRHCLVPRTEIEAVDIQTPIDVLKQKFLDTRLSRMVVFEKNIDNIAGYVHLLDLFKKPSGIQSILLAIPAVPESMSATDLITKFSRERKSIAWVVDEFGGTAGIVTMEDVLEEIFGDIKDEYDTEELVEKQLSENEYIFSGRIELHCLTEKYGLEFPQSESETLSGYIIDEHKSIPKFKERIIIGDYEFDVLNVSNTRIEMIKMKVLR